MKPLNTDNNYALKNSYQLVENTKKLKNIIIIVTYNFKRLINNINLQEQNKITYSLFQEYYTQLQFPDNISMDYLKL